MSPELLEQVSGYPGLFAVCSMSGILVPVPQDIALLYAGLRVGTGAFSWGPALAVAMPAVLLRDLIVYGLGRVAGDKILARPGFRRFVGEERLQRATELVERRATWSVLIGRGLVGVRSPVFLVAGASGIGFRRFLIVDGLGVLVTVPLAMWLGYAVGEPVLDMGLALLRSARVLGGLLIAGALFWFWRAQTQTSSG